MTPEAVKRAALQEYSSPDTGAVVEGKFFNIKDQSFFVIHFAAFLAILHFLYIADSTGYYIILHDLRKIDIGC